MKKSLQYWWWRSWFFNNIYSVVRHKIHRFLRAIRWHRECISKTHDFDAQYSFTLLRYQLSQVLSCMLGGYHDEEGKDYTKALRLAVKILEKLEDDYYGEWAWRKIEARWGKFDLYEGDGGLLGGKYLGGKYEKVSTDEERTQCIKDRMRMHLLADRLYQNNVNRFWRIFAKYHRNWWD